MKRKKRKSLYQDYLSTIANQIATLLLLVFVLVAIGTVGYMYLEKWTFLDSLYMTIITLATVGFEEVHQLDKAGEIFTICLIILGVGVVTYGITTFSKLLVEGEIKRVFDRRRIEKEMKKLSNHVIVCGFGRLGEKVSEDLHEKGEPFLVIEHDPTRVSKLEEKGYVYLAADISQEEVLEEAGIKKARALIAVLGSDADNLFTTLSARELNPKIHIVARVEDPRATRKLYKAGANRVISPYDMGARMLVSAALKPTISELIELSTRLGPFTLLMEEVVIEKGSPLDGVSIKDSKIREGTGATVVAVRKASTSKIMRPEPDLVLERGDLLVVLGAKEDIEKLEEMARPPHSL